MAKGRRVKYQDTGAYGNSLEGYKAPNGFYYSSQESYEYMLVVKQQKRRCIDKMGELLDIGENDFVPPVFVKMIGKYSKVGFDVLEETIEECKQDVKWALQHKEFHNDYQAAKYVDAILGNNYRRVKERMDAEKKSRQIRHDPEVEQGVVEFNRVNKNKDISALVGDIT